MEKRTGEREKEGITAELIVIIAGIVFLFFFFAKSRLVFWKWNIVY